MVEDSNSNKSPAKSPGTPDLPIEDGIKVPLSTEPQPVAQEAKFVKGDSKIDMVTPPAFSGLSKEELMKYSNDPFWVRLRMFLFILFWVAWLAMLVLAIVIIIQAPGCKAPPELLWVEEQALIEVDPQDLPTGADLEAKMNSLEISSVYFPNLINTVDLNTPNYAALDIIKHIVKINKKVVTDFPAMVDLKNPWYDDASALEYIHPNGSWNYKMENLTSVINTIFLNFWISEGVTGFLMLDNTNSEDKAKFKDELNELVKVKEAAIGSNIIDFESEKQNFSPEKFRAFLEETAVDWSFYKFNAGFASSSMSEEDLRLVAIGLFLYRGTPVLKYNIKTDNTTDQLIARLSKMRSLDGLKLGSANFANTTRNVVAFSRAYKGTPAYAIALNFNNGNETVNFEGTPYVGDSGTAEIESASDMNTYESREKYDLTSINLTPYQGMVLQFVAKF